ncbi:MAG: chemotaxis protein CheB, partial [Selenomonas sp.]|nr:chemotaxis protein CheB [Selenomonas sp.]
MGASTGGTEALSVVIHHLKPPLPGIVIVQHIPPMFSRLFAERLNSECELTIKEAASGDIVKPNHIYIAPGA